MNPTLAQELLRQAMTVAFSVAAPMLAAALVVGLLVTLLQTITSLQEQTLTFVPKLLVVGLVFTLTLPWIMRTLVQFLVELLRTLPRMSA